MKNVFPIIFFFSLALSHQSYSQSYNSLIISEIMADPLPVVGLPDVEYIEIFNRSDKSVSLKGWKFTIGTRSVSLPDSLIPSGSYALICHKNNVKSMTSFGLVIGANSFSLPNESGSLTLYNPKNQLVYSVSYFNKWWAFNKRNGGFSLEMIDTDNPCGEADNWESSTDYKGGTPAQRNSADRPNADVLPPVVERIDIPANNELIVVFNEKIDSLNAASGAQIALSGHKIISRKTELPLLRNLKLAIDPPLLKEQEYELQIHNISDCSGNLLRESVHQVSLPSRPEDGDIVINEILFNPKPNGADFVELFNRSSKYISLKNWTLGNLKNDSLNNAQVITTADLIVPPNSYLALTTDPTVVKGQYPTDEAQHFLELPSFPSFPNSEGGVVLKNNELKEFDRFVYDEKMHHEFFTEPKGVSLEKIDAGKPSSEASNWQSAAATVGYASPGYANSQVKPEIPEEFFTVTPEAFTPDLDGHDDYAVISFSQKNTGIIGTLRIYDINGRLVKNLITNQLIGTAGEIQWDGTDENGKLVPTGYYLVLIDTFDTFGNKKQYKKRVVLANKDM